jgi:hypothetical protein
MIRSATRTITADAPEWAFQHALAAAWGGGPRWPEACDDDERAAVALAHREVAAMDLHLAREERLDLERRVAAAPDAAHRYLERVRGPRRFDHMGYADFLRANAGHVLRMIAASIRPIAPGRYQATGFHAHPDGAVWLNAPSFTWVAANVSATRDRHPWSCKGRHLGHLIALAWDCDVSDGILAVVHTIAERCNPT